MSEEKQRPHLFHHKKEEDQRPSKKAVYSRSTYSGDAGGYGESAALGGYGEPAALGGYGYKTESGEDYEKETKQDKKKEHFGELRLHLTLSMPEHHLLQCLHHLLLHTITWGTRGPQNGDRNRFYVALGSGSRSLGWEKETGRGRGCCDQK
ncbi:hypothetical protein CKAN_01976200 [Cinnamomum micranthum f. kanehirae]|uniref:Uncharacterized protein n=1 Tax=Cinnamomum micranthum f. kanehirae TaxID=337451 RepID=A0A3S4PHQ7_9MAGN|nr:hypothetical protein CKAN_01976200 [Cinnamomum micranthum f. kanehirae]